MNARDMLYQFGLSRSCALVLVAYFLWSFGLQQALPQDESLLYTPLGIGAGVWPILLALIVIVNAITQECRRPRVTMRHRIYWQGLVTTTLAFLLFFSFCISFGYMKSLIPVFNPYYLDPWLQRLDIAMHGGIAPLQWFADFLTPSRTVMLNDLYLSTWVTVIAAYYLWQAIRPPSVARSQFISCFYLLWIIGGIVIATLAASVGPIYYDLFYQDAYSTMNAAFVEHMYGATATNTHGIDARQLLLDLQANGNISNLNGMSAMPSMHVGTALLIALHSYRHARKLLWFTIPFAILMFIGSVALGWHYALDTYVVALCVAILWECTRYDLRRA